MMPLSMSGHDTISLGIFRLRKIRVDASPDHCGLPLIIVRELVGVFIDDISTLLGRWSGLIKPLLNDLWGDRLDELFCLLAHLAGFEVHVFAFDAASTEEIHAHMFVWGLAEGMNNITGDLLEIRPSLIAFVSIHGCCFNLLGVVFWSPLTKGSLGSTLWRHLDALIKTFLL